jgi:hypothetical protein
MLTVACRRSPAAGALPHLGHSRLSGGASWKGCLHLEINQGGFLYASHFTSTDTSTHSWLQEAAALPTHANQHLQVGGGGEDGGGSGRGETLLILHLVPQVLGMFISLSAEAAHR